MIRHCLESLKCIIKHDLTSLKVWLEFAVYSELSDFLEQLDMHTYFLSSIGPHLLPYNCLISSSLTEHLWKAGTNYYVSFRTPSLYSTVLLDIEIY